jgi:GTP cyclohydrolase I
MELDKKNALPDVQSLHDGRNIAITRVGIRGVTLPITVESKHGPQHSVASLETTVSLPADQKGTHMSRFIALVEENDEPLNADVVRKLMTRMLERLEAREGTIKISFPFFVRKTAPVSRLDSLMNYQAAWIADAQDGEIRVRQEVTAPVTSLCPCSKEISRYGAHNQRSHLRSSLVLSVPMSLEEQISIAEEAASCQLWARLKRSDEKFVTEYAYDHPKFVEDLVRDMAKTLNADDRVDYYLVEAENFESIHNHSAYAYIERNKKA